MPYVIKNSNPKQTSRKALRLVTTFFYASCKNSCNTRRSKPREQGIVWTITTKVLPFLYYKHEFCILIPLFLVDTVTFTNIHNDGTYAKFRKADDSIVLVYYCMVCTASPGIWEVFLESAVEFWNMCSN